MYKMTEYWDSLALKQDLGLWVLAQHIDNCINFFRRIESLRLRALCCIMGGCRLGRITPSKK